MQTDPIADFLTRIRNGLRADHDEVAMPASTFKAELARILAEQAALEALKEENPEAYEKPVKDEETDEEGAEAPSEEE